MFSKNVKKIKRFSQKIALFSTLAVGIFVLNGQLVNAQEVNAEEKINDDASIKDDGSVKFFDENGEVMAIYTPYSETNPAPSVQPRYTGSVNWNLGLGWYAGSSRFEMNTNSKMDLNISISPNASSNIGLYNTASGSYGWPAGGESSTGWYGTISPSYSGNFSIAIANNTDKKVTYKGTFTVR